MTIWLYSQLGPKIYVYTRDAGHRMYFVWLETTKEKKRLGLLCAGRLLLLLLSLIWSLSCYLGQTTYVWKTQVERTVSISASPSTVKELFFFHHRVLLLLLSVQLAVWRIKKRQAGHLRDVRLPLVSSSSRGKWNGENLGNRIGADEGEKKFISIRRRLKSRREKEAQGNSVEGPCPRTASNRRDALFTTNRWNESSFSYEMSPRHRTRQKWVFHLENWEKKKKQRIFLTFWGGNNSKFIFILFFQKIWNERGRNASHGIVVI